MIALFAGDVAGGHFLPFDPHGLAWQLKAVVQTGRLPPGGERGAGAVLTADGGPVGYGVVRQVAVAVGGGSALELWMLGVVPEARGRGLGGRLVDGLLAAEPANLPVMVRVFPASAAMRALLARRGFEHLGRMRAGPALFFRGPPADAVLLRRALGGGHP